MTDEQRIHDAALWAEKYDQRILDYITAKLGRALTNDELLVAGMATGCAYAILVEGKSP